MQGLYQAKVNVVMLDPPLFRLQVATVELSKEQTKALGIDTISRTLGMENVPSAPRPRSTSKCTTRF